MKALALTLALCLLSSAAHAADGDICKPALPGTTTAQSWCYITPPAALVAEGNPKIVTQLLCDGKGSGGAGTGVTCGPVWMPQGGVPFSQMVIRTSIGPSTTGCGFDNWKVYSIQPINGTCSTSDNLNVLAVLDDDGTATPSSPASGTQFVEIGAATGPCLYLVGDTTAGTCDATHLLYILADYYFNPAISH